MDTNIPKTANLAVDPDNIKEELLHCVVDCIEAIEHVINKKNLVIDSENEIFYEYRRQLSLSGQPGVGDIFVKWVHDHRWALPAEDRVRINKNGHTYDEFPDHEDLINFDNADRKFVAVANAHPADPSILQATDCKWWGWKNALEEVGIPVCFLCPDYVAAKYSQTFDR